MLILIITNVLLCFFHVLDSEYAGVLEKNWPVGIMRIWCRLLSQQDHSKHGQWREVNLDFQHNKSYPSELKIILNDLDGFLEDGSLYIEVKLEKHCI